MITRPKQFHTAKIQCNQISGFYDPTIMEEMAFIRLWKNKNSENAHWSS